MKLKPYTGSHAGHLYHVIDDEGRVIRNASVLEVKLWHQISELIDVLEVAALHLPTSSAKNDRAMSHVGAVVAADKVRDAIAKVKVAS